MIPVSYLTPSFNRLGNLGPNISSHVDRNSGSIPESFHKARMLQLTDFQRTLPSGSHDEHTGNFQESPADLLTGGDPEKELQNPRGELESLNKSGIV